MPRVRVCRSPRACRESGRGCAARIDAWARARQSLCCRGLFPRGLTSPSCRSHAIGAQAATDDFPLSSAEDSDEDFGDSEGTVLKFVDNGAHEQDGACKEAEVVWPAALLYHLTGRLPAGPPPGSPTATLEAHTSQANKRLRLSAAVEVGKQFDNLNNERITNIENIIAENATAARASSLAPSAGGRLPRTKRLRSQASSVPTP